MSVTLSLPAVLTRLTDGARTIEASGATVGDVVSDVAGRFPLRDEQGNPYSFVTFYLNDEDIRFTGGFATVVRDGDELIIVPAIAGG
jgi:molybdopterin synthase sulfur carrier subunit